jgi:hypothetical protein
VPIAVDSTSTEVSSAQVLDYTGFGDPDGVDGDVRSPDDSISNLDEGSGAKRLLVVNGADGPYRVKVTSHTTQTSEVPGEPSGMSASASSPTQASVTFVEPEGQVRGYDIKISAGAPMTSDSFETTGRAISTNIVPAGAGSLQTVNLENLLPETHYWVAIRAHDSCLEGGTAHIVELDTPRRENGEVTSCFVATAAFGSPLMADVTLLRAFRDRVLRHTAVGELLVETYYTFGPALAGVIRPSDALRAVTRAALAPVVDGARVLLK